MHAVRITIGNCETDTIVDMDVTGEQLSFLIDVGRRVNLAAGLDCCEPDMWIEVLDANDAG